MQITTARPEEIEEIWDFIDTAFKFPPGYFRDRLSWQWQAECVDWDGVFLIRGQNGRLDSLVRLWELQLVQNGKPVTCGGIGSVSTGTHARGQGGMTALMQHAESEMKRRGYPLGILGGDRFRYATFNYETAGRTLTLSVSARGLKRNGVAPIEPYEFNGEILARLEATRAQMPFHVRRRACESKHMYRTPTRQVLAAGTDDFGFLAFDQDKLIEWGGDVNTVLGLAAYAAQEQMASSFLFAFPDGAPIPEAFHPVMSGWSLNPAFRAVMYDLEKTLEAFDALEYQAELAHFTPREQVWHLFGKPNAPRNLWFFHLDLV